MQGCRRTSVRMRVFLRRAFRKVVAHFGHIKLPALLLLVMLAPFVTEGWLSYDIRSFFYALSLTIKSVLVFLLPFVVFSFVAVSFIRLGGSAWLFAVLLAGMVFLSNITAIFTGYAIGCLVVPMIAMPVSLDGFDGNGLGAMWVFELMPLCSNMTALLLGIVAGILVNAVKKLPLRDGFCWLADAAGWGLVHGFVPLLPFFILGFAFKLHADGILSQALLSFGPLLALVILVQICYLLGYFLLAANFSVQRLLRYIGNILPVWLTGLGTLSSAAAMPVLIEGTGKNLGNHAMARTIVPITINIHTIGSAICLTILALMILNTFDQPLPSLPVFAVFAFFFALTKFSVAAVPGGVVLVVGPILQSLLGFSDEMLGLITALYVIFDPFGTATNVSGNGAFAIVFDRLCHSLDLVNIDDTTSSEIDSSSH